MARIAGRQLGLVTTAQAAGVGVRRELVRDLARDGVLRRRFHGVYAMAGAPDTREHRWLAALLSTGPATALSHRTAGTLHGLEHGLTHDAIHLVAPRSSRRRSASVRWHEAPGLPAAEVTTVGLHRVTSGARTLCDLAGELQDTERLRAVTAAAVRRGVTDVGALSTAIERRGRFAGRAALRSLLAQLSPLEAQTRSELESRFLRLTTRAGVAPTAVNHRVVDADGRVRHLDAVWLPEGVYAELDSRAHHGTLLDWHDDLRRENAVAVAGFHTCLRFTWWDLEDHAEQVVATVLAALEGAPRVSARRA